MIYKSKVITKKRLGDLLLWSRLANHQLNFTCEYIGTEYDFSKYEWIGDETIVTAVNHYIDDYTAQWITTPRTDTVLVKIATETGNDDYFYLNSTDFDKLTDVEHQDSMAGNDLFVAMLEFYKEHGVDYESKGTGNLEDWTLPLTILLKHIKRHENAKFRATTDIDHLLLWMSDRWDLYLPYFKEHMYDSTAIEDQAYMFNKFFERA